jgi:hypothetical protein
LRPEIENTPLPVWMADLKRDPRGYPIPYIALVDKTGVAHFTINHEPKRQEVISKDLCGICGKKLLRWRALVGGPVSAFMEDGAYIDPAMHIECCQYALKVCPYLALPSFTKEIGAKKLKAENMPGDTPAVLVDNTMMKDKPTFFVLVVHTRCEKVFYDPATKTVVQYLKPKKPYVRAEYWHNGIQLEEQDGLETAKAALYLDLIKQYPNANRLIEESFVRSLLSRTA